MSSRAIKVSIITACRNSSAYLDEAVRSILTQTMGDLELILIDDCSTDDTLQIARRYQKEDSRVVVISLPEPSGPAITRNAGIKAARGAYLGILDSDDVALPSRFEEQMRLADSDEDLVLIGSSSIFIDSTGAAIEGHKYPTCHRALVQNLYAMRAFPPHSSMVYKKAAVERVGGFNPRYERGQDYDLWVRLSEIGRIASIGHPLAKIRKHATNISRSEGAMMWLRFGCAAAACHFLRVRGHSDPSAADDERQWRRFLAWVEHRITEEGIFDKRREWINARSEYFAAKNAWVGAFRFCARLLMSGHPGSLVREKVFGIALPERLAREWGKMR